MEIRQVPGYNGRYFADEYGNIHGANGILKARPNGRGYLHIHPSVKGRKLTRTIHRMVLEAWVGPRPSGLVGRHLDGDPHNNKPGNLAWGTYSANRVDQIAHGTSGRSLDEVQVREIIKLDENGASVREIADQTSTHTSTVRHILTGKTYQSITGRLYQPRNTKRGRPPKVRNFILTV